MKKKYIVIIPILLLVSIVGITFTKINPRKLTTDSGFDSSWDSGSGWDSGSDWDSGSSWDRDYGSSGGSYHRGTSVEGDELFIDILIAVVVTFAIMYVFNNPEIRKYRKEYGNSFTKANLSDFGLTKLNVVNSISDIFVEYQKSHFIDKVDGHKEYFSETAIKTLDQLRTHIEFDKIKDIRVIDAFLFTVEKNQNLLKISIEIFLEYTGSYSVIKRFSLETYYSDEKYTIDKVKSFGIKDLGGISSIKQSSDSDIDEKLQKIGYDKYGLINKAYNIYVDVQNAWMNDTLDDVQNVLSSELYNQYEAQLTSLRVKKQQNVMGDFNYIDSYISSVKEDDKAIYFTILLCVSCKDYLIQKETNKVIRGSSTRINTYRYYLTFRFGKNPIEECPGCGSKLDSDSSSIKCEYCGCDINRFSKNMVLTDKKMISQS